MKSTLALGQSYAADINITATTQKGATTNKDSRAEVIDEDDLRLQGLPVRSELIRADNRVATSSQGNRLNLLSVNARSELGIATNCSCQRNINRRSALNS